MSVVLSEHLPMLASAPGGILKLRGLILELAVRGKLVAQDPNDEPASELLKRVAVKRERLAADASSKKPTSMLLAEEGDYPFAVPSCWDFIRLCDIVDPRRTITYGVLKPGAETPNGIPLVKTENVYFDRVTDDFTSRISPELDRQYSRTKLVGGEILLTLVGSIGRCAIAPVTIAGANLSRSVGMIVPVDELSKRYLVLAISTAISERFISENCSGTAQKVLNIGTINEVWLPIPPLSEQHRVVAKVDKLMALCDSLESERADAASAHARLVETLLGTLTQSTDAADLARNWQRLAEHFDTLFATEASIDALKQTVLQLAVMGKLVPHNPNDESASKLYADLMNLTSEETKSGESLIEVEMPYQLPSGWHSARLNDVTTIISGNAFKSEDFKTAGNVRAIKIANVGVGEFYESDDFLPDTFGSLFAKFCVQHGDILIALTRPYIAGGLKVCRCPKSYNAALLNQRVGAIKIDKSKDISSFVYLYLTSNFALDYVIEKSRTLNQPNLNIPDLRNLSLPLPPLAEQYRIVAKVDELMALCDRLKADLATARQRQTTLADTLIESALEVA